MNGLDASILCMLLHCPGVLEIFPPVIHDASSAGSVQTMDMRAETCSTPVVVINYLEEDAVSFQVVLHKCNRCFPLHFVDRVWIYII